MYFIKSLVIVTAAAFAVSGITIDAGYEDYGIQGNGYQNYLVGQEAYRKEEKKDKQDFSKIPGIPGHDYPIYHTVPHTSFSCKHVPALPGMYANVETGCQAYHVCHDGREGEQGSSFLCTNGTLFNQKEFACDWWYNVNCKEAINLYSLNLDPKKNPYFQKRKDVPTEEEKAGEEVEQYIKIII
ncbi:uncharacterized protein LOC126748350 [Anthonomus grandis grandis]|uniref:uncharacterized protein LOC126748350 n=1 Tax=Anthonomus grandis grandis TaxID=2921223 RepID=UPI00216529B8|nr:uncharacterized protein LOC126748350 [Anthonomus grandis grandis]